MSTPARLRYGPDHPATLTELLARTGPAWSVQDPDGTLGREAFAELVLRCAGGLRAAGIRPGERVALWLPNMTAYLAAIFACARLGVLAIHINTRFRGSEVGALLRRSKAVAVVTRWGFAPVDFPAIFSALPAEDRAGVRMVFAAGGTPVPATIAGLDVRPLAGDGAAAGPDDARPDSPCLTFTTSGTTSGPKLVMHDQQTIAGHALDVARRAGLDQPRAGLLGAVPFCGTFGNAAAMAAIAGSARIACLPVFDGEAAAELVRSQRLTHLFGGDDMLGRIATAADGRPFDGIAMSGFAAFHSGAAESIAAAEAAGLAPRGLYGSSEVQALFSFAQGANRFLGGGQPTNRDATLSIRDPETGADLPVGASGELWISAPSRFVEYLDNPEATAKAIAPDGAFRTGDLAHLDGDGFVFEARIGDAMRLGGFLVAPEEIEAFLQAEPGVAGVQVVAAAREGHNPVPVAFVQADRPNLDVEALLARCREGLARFKVPARIVLVDRFPIVESPNGPKVQKVRLRREAEALLNGRPTSETE